MVVELLRGLESRFPWICEVGRRPARSRAAGPQREPAGARAPADRPGVRRLPRAPRVAARVPIGAGGQPPRRRTRRSRTWTSRPTPPAEVPAAGSFAPNLAPMITSAPSSAGGVPVSAARTPTRALAPELSPLDVRRATEVVVPTANLLGQTVSIRGNGAETVGGVEGAVDRIAIEIIRHLEQGPTLVVWAFDASGSLLAERQRLGQAHRDRLHPHQPARREPPLRRQRPPDDGRRLRPGPQADAPQADDRPVRDPRGDPRGPPGRDRRRDDLHDRRRDRQQVGALQGTRRSRAYRTMIIVVTDEVGDDESQLEDAIVACQQGQGAGLRPGLAGDLRPDRELRHLHRPQDQARLPRSPGAAGARERDARADPPAVLVRRAAVRGPRVGLRALCA